MRILWQAGSVLIVIIIGLFLIPRSSTPLITDVAGATSSAASVVVATDSPTLKTDTYRVVKVVDGDTLAIEMDGKSVTVRLIGLDTPETVDPRKPVQCFGKAASDKAKELLTNARVKIEQDPSQGEFDKYGRLLAYVYLPDLPDSAGKAGGTFFNKYMIAEGYGHEYTYNLPYKYQQEFKATEVSARENKRGLWADTACATQSVRTSNAASPAAIAAPSGAYDCSHNVYNCSSFKTQAEAQKAFDTCGGDSNDVHKLDSDKDGRVCESLP